MRQVKYEKINQNEHSLMCMYYHIWSKMFNLLPTYFLYVCEKTNFLSKYKNMCSDLEE